MLLFENIRQALQHLKNNAIRATLTLFIIGLGIMALVGIFTAIDAAIFSLRDNLTRLGANTIQLRPVGSRFSRQDVKKGDPISYRQASLLKKRMGAEAIFALALNGTNTATIKYRNEKTNPNVRITGVDENYLELKSFKIEKGRNLSFIEAQSSGRQALIGQDVVKKLFNKESEKALGKPILINNQKFTVTGVLESKGSGMGSSQDNLILIPLLTAKVLFGTGNANYDITIANTSDLSKAKFEDQIIGQFRAIRSLRISDDNDFEIVKDDSLEKMLRENTATIQMGAIFIGLLTLLGAAIGLMNIMLVSVTERTKEIGVAKALGATRRNILIQFLTEAIIICQLGGILGIFLGILAGNVVSMLLGGSFIIPWLWIFLGITICFIVGVFSGLYPAIKASRLDPIESLRHA